MGGGDVRLKSHAPLSPVSGSAGSFSARGGANVAQFRVRKDFAETWLFNNIEE